MRDLLGNQLGRDGSAGLLITGRSFFCPPGLLRHLLRQTGERVLRVQSHAAVAGDAAGLLDGRRRELAAVLVRINGFAGVAGDAEFL